MKVETLQEIMKTRPRQTFGLIFNDNINDIDHIVRISSNDEDNEGFFITEWKIPDGVMEDVKFGGFYKGSKNEPSEKEIKNIQDYIYDNVEKIDKKIKASRIENLGINYIMVSMIRTIHSRVRKKHNQESKLITALLSIHRVNFFELEIDMNKGYRTFLKGNPTSQEIGLFKSTMKEQVTAFELYQLYVERTDISAELKYLLWMLTVARTWDSEHYIKQFKNKPAGEHTKFKNKLIKILERSDV